MKTETKKVIAIIKGLDEIEYDYYFNNMIENYENNLIIDGGKNYNSYNNNLLEKIKNIKNDFEVYSFEGFKSEQEYFNYNLPKENKTSWSDAEIETFKNNFNYCDILKIITNKNFEKTILTGYAQGERIQVFYNSDIVKSEDLNMLECLYFGGCNEIIYTTEETTPENIYDCNYINIITYKYNKNDIIDILKNDTGIENIKLYEEKQKQVIKTYYEEI